MLTKLKITKLDNKGRGITYYNNKIMFVTNALPDEGVVLDNIKEYKKYYEATNYEVINSNPNRIKPNCKYFLTCGGCNLMHMKYDYQLEFKKEKIQDILKKYANIDTNIDIIKSNNIYNYRNKIELKIKDSKIGYYMKSSHEIVAIDNCLLATNSINELIKNNLFNIINGNITIRSNYKDEILLIIDTKDNINLSNIPSNIKGIILNNKLVYGTNYLYDYIGEYKFKITYNSFFQINNYIANKIFEILKSNLKGDILLDLYCGIGTLSISLKDNFNKIIGIEKITNAIKDAKYNAKINHVLNSNYYAGDTYKILSKLNIKPDTIIIDPPRSGLNKDTLNEIININPNVIAYISCDPMTLSRDLNILKNYYNIRLIKILDMFPNTYHIETIVILDKSE